MNINSFGKNKFIVELTREDMKELDITYEEMDYSDIETRRVIWTIIDKACDELGERIDPSENLVIEAASDSSGGCVLVFTTSEKKKQRYPLTLTKSGSGSVYEFSDENTFLDMLRFADKSSIKGVTSVYKNREGAYRVILPCPPCGINRKIFEEYGSFIGKDDYTLSFTKEYWDKAGGI